MPEISRTLVKSVPELWAELSDPEPLGRHLEAFGALTITAAHPESRVEWDAERGGGTIHLEPSGFGTRVTCETELKLADPPQPDTRGESATYVRTRFDPSPSEPEVAPEEPEPAAQEPEVAPEEPAKRGFLARLFRRKPPAGASVADAPPLDAAVDPAPRAEPPPPPPPPPDPPREPLIDPAEAEAALTAMLDLIGTARHRPFSRA